MKSRRMLSLLTAAALSGGVITVANIAPPVVAAAETMADQYQPYYDYSTGLTTETMPSTHVRSNMGLPAGTKFFLENSADYLIVDGIYITIDEHNGRFWFKKWPGTHIPGNGKTISSSVTVLYPDYSAEVIPVTVTLMPPNSEGYDVHYGDTSLEPGTTSTFRPADPELPLGTNVAVINNSNTQNLRNQGWVFTTGDSATLTVSAPEAATESVSLQLSVSYPDGTTELTTVDIDLASLIPPHSRTHDVTYPQVTLTAGGALTVLPQNTDLPDGTLLFLSQDQNLDNARNAGWTIDNYLSGEFFVTAPITATEGIQLTFQVVYPDGTFEYTTADISVDPANHADNHDVTYPPTTITAGNTTTITPATSDLPTGTIITLVEDLFLRDARNAGWEIDADTNGTITVSAPVTSTSGTTVSVLITYPDGTQEQVFAPIEVVATNHAGNHDVTYPATTITAGNTTTITPLTSGLPAGTTITLVKDRKFNTAQAAGWTFTIAADGKITASSIETSVGYAVINVLITYPDGTSETTEASISAIAKPIDEQPVDEKPAPSQKVSGSSFGSS